jgi:hypothetical protein
MKGLAIAALALLTFVQFPGHTWLQQDSQIYAPLLEHQRDPSVLRHDILVKQSLLAYTLYDETAQALRNVTGLGFREVLAFEQVLARALGIWGLYLMAEALGLRMSPALLVAAICSLGATIAGPTVLAIEYEPTPRAFAVPMLICAVGLAAHRRYLGAGIAAAGAFLYHAPTTLPFMGFAPLLAAPAFAHLTPLQEQIQRIRAPYVWVSTWPADLIVHHLILFAVLLIAFVRIRREIQIGRASCRERV